MSVLKGNGGHLLIRFSYKVLDLAAIVLKLFMPISYKHNFKAAGNMQWQVVCILGKNLQSLSWLDF